MGIFDRLFGSKKTQPVRTPQSSPPIPVTPPAASSQEHLEGYKPSHTVQQTVPSLAARLCFCERRCEPAKRAGARWVFTGCCGKPLEEIIKQAGGTDLISNSTVEAELNQTGKIPESAFQAMGVLAPALIAKARNGQVRVCVRTLDDPPSRQSAAVFLLYNNG